VLQQVRNLLNVYYIRDAVAGNVGQAAITVVFKEAPREEVASTIKAITDYYGFNLYTFVADSAQLAMDDAVGLEPYDDQTESES
jgi:hypothetical protein